MRRLGPCVTPLLILLATLPPSGANGATPATSSHVYGPPPDWESYRRIGEAALRAQLVDPDSARIDWPFGYHKGGFKPFLMPRVEGYVTCGTVNARNRMGGYAGSQAFVVVIDYDRPLYVEIAKSATDMTSAGCDSAISSGLLPPVSSMAGVTQAMSPGQKLGLAIQPMKEGAYVSAVATGSVAQIAGLRPGMVITSVNGIALGGMGDMMARLIDSVTGDVTLSLVGGRTLLLKTQAASAGGGQ